MPWAALLHLIMACFMYGENELLVSSVINPELVAGVDDSSGVQAVSQAYDTFLKETSLSGDEWLPASIIWSSVLSNSTIP